MFILRSIKFTTALAALVLFFLPWIEIRISDKVLATQTGMQAITGGSTPGPAARMWRQTEPSEDSLGSATLVAGALITLGITVLLVGLGLHFDHPVMDLAGSVSCAMALLFLLGQAMQEFPASQTLKESISADQASLHGDVGAMIMVMMMDKLEVVMLPEFMMACGLSAVPMLIGLLQFAAIIKLKKLSQA